MESIVKAAKPKRLYFIDNLKVFLTMLVIVHHCGQAYGPTGGFWPYKSSIEEIIPTLGSFFAVNAAFFMGLFFMLAGYFLPGSYERKGCKALIKDKVKRYGIPLLLGLFVLSPIMMYFYYINYSGNIAVYFMSYYKNIYMGIGSRPIGFKEIIGWPEINLAHLWFIQHLLVYSVIYAVVRACVPKLILKRINIKANFSLLVGIAIITALVTAVVRVHYPIDKWIPLFGFIQAEVAHLPQYIIFFIIGIIAFKKDWFIEINKKVGYTAFLLGGIMAGVVYLEGYIPIAITNIIFENWAFYDSFMAVFLCWGLIVFFRERVNISSKTLKVLSDNTYTAYIVHFPLILVIQYGLSKVEAYSATGEFILVSILSITLTFFLIWLVKRITYPIQEVLYKKKFQ